ncbi:MAG: hypothetical protein IKJ91_10145 [Clostridia bacterium]|nr:hypothetical protein [Clostridia bacterium]
MRKISLIVFLVSVLVLILATYSFATSPYGDICPDGRVDVKDAVVLAQHLAGWKASVSLIDLRFADVNCDASVDIKDAVTLSQYLAKWDVILGSETETIDMIYTRGELLAVIKAAYESKGTIIGEINSAKYDNMINIAIEDFKSASGGYLPGMIGLDIGDAFMSGYTSNNQIDEMVEQITEYAKMGGIVHTWMHMTNPSPRPEDKTAWNHIWAKLGNHTEEDWQQLLTEGTEYNTKLKTALDKTASFLKRLRDNGVPVIWRPYHEHSGTWFWWCMGFKDSEGNYLPEHYFSDLWIYTYKYFTEEWGLDNLVWMFCPTTGDYAPQLYGYPGDEYVDLVGFDWYTGGDYHGQDMAYNSVVTTGKPVCVGEFGVAGEAKAEKIEDQPSVWSCENLLEFLETADAEGRKYGFWCNWSTPHQLSQLGKLDVLMESPLVYGLDEVKKLFESLNK